jgi:hypothetical protein
MQSGSIENSRFDRWVRLEIRSYSMPFVRGGMCKATARSQLTSIKNGCTSLSYPMRTGVNYSRSRSNSPKVEVHSDSKDGGSRLRSHSARVYMTTATIQRLSGKRPSDNGVHRRR